MKKTMGLIASALISALISASPASARTESASAIVVNKTGKDIVSISIVHKYSDVHRNSKTWTQLFKNGESTPRMSVQYNRGFGTTGVDWWYVSFVHPSEKPVLNYSDPTNFRAAIDFLERGSIAAVPALIKGAVEAAATACVGSSAGACAPLAVGATAAAAVAGQELADRLLNDESTAGFKRHMLEKEDADGLVTITLLPQGKIEISSPSGKSPTVYSSKEFDVSPDVEAAIAASLPAKVEALFPNDCSTAVQGKLVWDNGSNTKWDDNNVRNLCGLSTTAEPARCFETVTRSGFLLGGSTVWSWEDAVKLCSGTNNAANRIACYLGTPVHMQASKAAIEACSGAD